MRSPRWIAWLYAVTHGYYWSTCKFCGKHYGGHESGHAGYDVCCSDCGPREQKNWMAQYNAEKDAARATQESEIGYFYPAKRPCGIYPEERLEPGNAFGSVMYRDMKGSYPVICGHGGSMWLCQKCADEFMQVIQKERTAVQ